MKKIKQFQEKQFCQILDIIKKDIVKVVLSKIRKEMRIKEIKIK